ncbi:MAG TPA: alpha-rhamnosidase, partial [Lentisphaeria bacterium]|nr:alpha-rhamnosidase [Lentisphaeria bacterium]
MNFEPVKWLGAAEQGGAPYFRCEFDAETVAGATLAICGLGWYEVCLNGRKVGDHVLDPIVTNYDLRARYVVYDVAAYLKPGRNTVGVVLGTGWYDHVDADVWNFDHAAWRDRCKFALHLRCGGAELVSGEPAGWRCTTAGPITFNSLRNGEYYDARLEMAGWAENGFDDSTWQVPVPLAPPGGVLEEQTSPPCRVMRVIRPVALKRLSPTRAVADFGVNLSG